jgi:hypothetical protein
MKNKWSPFTVLLPVLLLTAFLFAAYHPKSRAAAQSEPPSLTAGDYLREEYIQAVTETRSPWAAWQRMKAGKNETVETIRVTNDKSGLLLTAGYNFHEGGDPARPETDGGLSLDNSPYSIHVLDNNEFDLSNSTASMRFRYVGDMQKWANEAMIAGVYEDEKGQKYIFTPDGQAQFPGNLTFDYSAGLDMIFSSYDYIYSVKLKKTWAVKTDSHGLNLFDVDMSGDNPEGVVSSTPRWTLKKLSN